MTYFSRFSKIFSIAASFVIGYSTACQAQLNFSIGASIGEDSHISDDMITSFYFDENGESSGDIEFRYDTRWQPAFAFHLGLGIGKRIQLRGSVLRTEDHFLADPRLFRDDQLFSLRKGTSLERVNLGLELEASYNYLRIFRKRDNPILLYTGIALQHQRVISQNFDTDFTRFSNQGIDWSKATALLNLFEQDVKKTHTTLTWTNRLEWRFLFFEYSRSIFPHVLVDQHTTQAGSEKLPDRVFYATAANERWALGVQFNVWNLKKASE